MSTGSWPGPEGLEGRRVHVHDVVMRDGLQNEPVFVPTDDKVLMVDALSRAPRCARSAASRGGKRA